jgi:hypothetical protein
MAGDLEERPDLPEAYFLEIPALLTGCGRWLRFHCSHSNEF